MGQRDYIGELIYTGLCPCCYKGGARTGTGEQDSLHTVAPKDVLNTIV